MAVREFDGVDDGITLGPGTLQSFLWGDFTYAFIVKRGAGSDGDNGRVFSTRTAVTGCFEALFNDGSPINTLLNVGRNPVDVDSASSFTVTASSDWVVVGADKATGTNAPRSHRCVMSTGTWTHSDNPNTLQNQATSMGALGAIEIGICSAGDPSAFFAGRYAVGAIWSRRLSDAEWETLDTSLQNWVDLAPDALWAFNQASVATPVEDLSTVGTADQTAITGTTVITTDDPPGFDFTLGPVREFDGTDDRIDCAIGALSGMTFGTVAAIVKAAAGGRALTV